MTASPLSDDEAARLFAPFADETPPLLAVSGGPDSTALMGLYATCYPQSGAVVATVDHGLRPEAAAEAAQVAVAASRLGLAHVTLNWSGARPTSRIQEAAREARYGLLHRLCYGRGLGGIMLAHTLDDQAETVLMRLMHGSGLRGLAGMQARSRRQGIVLLRPFLSVPKARLVATCETRGWSFLCDPSNESPAFLRPRLRTIMPLLEKEGLSASRLAVLARRAGEADQLVERLAREALARGVAMGGIFPVEAFLATEPVVATRLLAILIEEHAVGQTFRLEQIEALSGRLVDALAENKPFHATLAGVKVSRQGDFLRFSTAPPRRSRR